MESRSVKISGITNCPSWAEFPYSLDCYTFISSEKCSSCSHHCARGNNTKNLITSPSVTSAECSTNRLMGEFRVFPSVVYSSNNTYLTINRPIIIARLCAVQPVMYRILSTPHGTDRKDGCRISQSEGKMVIEAYFFHGRSNLTFHCYVANALCFDSERNVTVHFLR